MGQKQSTEEYITLAKKVHGERYDYSQTVYRGRKNPIVVMCPSHGNFSVRPQFHLTGSGSGSGCGQCPECVDGTKKEKLLEQNKKWLREVLEVHGDKYDYSLVYYTKPNFPVKIICKHHGVFEQRPDVHRRGANCQECMDIARGETKQLPENKWFSGARKIHDDKYNYSLVNDVRQHVLVSVICPKHDAFEILSGNHLRGMGCPDCKQEEKINRFINKSNKAHNSKYDYSLVQFKTLKDRIKIICPNHGVYEQQAGSHSYGAGCRKCNEEATAEDKYRNQRTWLYFLFFPDYDVYKVGITKTTLAHRFQTDIRNGIKFEVLLLEEFEDGMNAWEIEQQTIKENTKMKSNKYFLQSGNTELFTDNIQNYITERITNVK